MLKNVSHFDIFHADLGIFLDSRRSWHSCTPMGWRKPDVVDVRCNRNSKFISKNQVLIKQYSCLKEKFILTLREGI